MLCDAIVERIHELSPGVYHAVLNVNGFEEKARPGQFLMVQTGQTADPLLKRPFSICDATDATAELLFNVRGRGTRHMAKWQQGVNVQVLGPLGNGFQIIDFETALIVAGGMGIAPLLYLANTIAQRSVVNVQFLIGGKSRKDIGFCHGLNLPDNGVAFSTEDGSEGYHGRVTDLLEKQLDNMSISSSTRLTIFGCGPIDMLRRLAGIARRHSIPCQVSLESPMACGIGACLGCAVLLNKWQQDGLYDTGSFEYRMVCCDGPVFDGSALPDVKEQR